MLRFFKIKVVIYRVEYRLQAEAQPRYLLPIISIYCQVGTACFLPHFQGNRMIHCLKAPPAHPHVLQLLSILEIFGLCFLLEGPFSIQSNETQGLALL